MLDIAAEKNKEKDAYVINLSGILDSETSRDFESFFADMLDRGYIYYILESSRLKNMSSSGIAGLVQFLKNVYESGGALCFTGVNREVRMLLEFSGIASKSPCFSSMREAENYIKNIISNSNAISSPAAVKRSSGRDVYEFPRYSESAYKKSDRAGMSKEKMDFYQGAADVKGETMLRKPPVFAAQNSLSGIPVPSEDSIIECEQCGATMRIYKSGRHMCPSCGIEFFVKHDGSASYYEKLAE